MTDNLQPQPFKVLILGEENSPSLRSFEDIFASAGYQSSVMDACAIEEIILRKPDLVAFHYSDSTGFEPPELFFQIRNSSEAPDLPVIFFGPEKLLEKLRTFHNLNPAQTIIADSSSAPLLLASSAAHLIERKRKRDAVRQIEKRLQAIIDTSPNIISIIGDDGKILYESPRVEPILGYTPEALTDTSLVELVHPDDRDNLPCAVESAEIDPADDGSKNTEGEYRLLHQDEKWVDTHSVSRIVVENDGKSIRVVNLTDLTARNDLKKALELSETRFESLFKDSPAPAYVWEFEDEDFALVDFNNSALAILQEQSEKFFREKASVLLRDYPHILESIKQAYMSKQPVEIIADFRFSHDVERKLEITSCFVEPNLVISHTRDLTAKFKAVESLKQTQARIEMISRSVNDIFWDWNIANKTLWLNDAFYAITGATSSEKQDSIETWLDYVHPDDKTRVNRELNDALDGTETQWSAEYRLMTAQPGGYRYFLNRGQIVRDEQGKAVRISGVAVDTTDHRQLTEELQQSQEYLRIAQQAANAGSFSFDLESLTGDSNPELKELYGCPPRVWSNVYQEWREFVYEDDLPVIDHALEHAIKTGELNSEFRIIGEQGEISWILGKGRVSYDENGKPIRLIGVNVDITEQKLVTEKLRESEERYRVVAESASDGLVTTNADSEIAFVNPAAAKIFGYERDELIGADFSDLFDSEFIETHRKAIQAIQAGGARPDSWSGNEVSGRNKSGETLDLEISFGVSEVNNSLTVTAVIRDIGARKEIDARIRRNEAMLAKAQRIAHVGSWEWDLESGTIVWSDEHFRIFGLEVSEKPVSYELFDEMVHPAYRQTVKDEVERAIKYGQHLNVVYHIVRKDTGEQRIVHSLGEIVRDDSGKAVFASGTIQDITEFREIESKLKESEMRYRYLAESMPQQVWTALPDGTVDYANRRWIESYGMNPEEAARSGYEDVLHPDDIEACLGAYYYAIEHGTPFESESRLGRKNSEYRWHLIRAFPMKDSQGKVLKWLGTNTDIHDLKVAQDELKKTQSQLRQSQKLESIGRLAGGIAHDFNNMLTAINGYSSLILKSLPEGNPLTWQVEEIKKAGERSARLTQQLLAFSRQQVLKPEILDVSKVVAETSMMLQRLISENIRLSIKSDPDLDLVEVDPGQLTQVIVNLAINACDAMPDGGELIIETANVELDESYRSKHFPAKPGKYVMIAVQDTGVGMDKETKEHIFEPFFTTKGVGKGTGLGLATVHGIVTQSGGLIWLYSELGKGTTFKIFFPKTVQKPYAAGETRHSKQNLGTESILLVEDEEMVRNLARHILDACGYSVIEAKNGVEALKICRDSQVKIDLVITDVVMPEMGGRELADALRDDDQKFEVLYMSGYTNDVILKQFATDTTSNFIQKPFTFESFAMKVREILDNKLPPE